MVVVVPQVQQEKHKDGSFVKVSSKDITKRAYASLASIKLCKARDTQRLIERERIEVMAAREKKRNSLWSRLFGYKEKPEPTDAELLKSIETQRGDGIWLPETFWIDVRYDKYIEVANRLINAAKYADEIFVSTEDLERLL